MVYLGEGSGVDNSSKSQSGEDVRHAHLGSSDCGRSRRNSGGGIYVAHEHENFGAPNNLPPPSRRRRAAVHCTGFAKITAARIPAALRLFGSPIWKRTSYMAARAGGTHACVTRKWVVAPHFVATGFRCSQRCQVPTWSADRPCDHRRRIQNDRAMRLRTAPFRPR